MKSWITRLLFAVGMLVGFGGLSFFALTSSVFRVEQVSFVLAEKGKTSEVLFDRIKKEMQPVLKPYSNKIIWSVNLSELLGSIEKDRRIQSLRVVRKFPNKIEVQVSPQKPLLALLDQKGKLRPLAADASLLPVISLKDLPDVPLFRSPKAISDIQLRLQALSLLESLPKTGSLTQTSVSEIAFDSKDGFSLLLIPNATQVKLGFDQFKLRATLVERVLKYLDSQSMQGSVIDARFNKKVVVSLRNAP